MWIIYIYKFPLNDNNIDMIQASKTDNENNRTPHVIVAIIPAYNESESIGKIVSETKNYVNSVIVVDDGSSDNTAEIAASMNARVVRNRYNSGKGAALKRGLIECLRFNPDIIVTLDADGQHDPAEIPKLVEPIV